MPDHLTRELLRAISQGWRDPGDLAGMALAHLLELCPHCRREFEVWRAALTERPVAEEDADYDAVLDRIRRSDAGSNGVDASLDHYRQEARSRAEELLSLPSEQQANWIRSEAEKHSGLLLAEALIEQCRLRTPGYPREGVELGILARLVLQHAPTSPAATELYARALARLANGTRVIGDLLRADQILGDSRYFLKSQGGGDRLVRAELDGLGGSLRIDQERSDEAVPLLLHALMTYRLEKAPSAAAAVLIKLANAHKNLGDGQRSLSLLSEAEGELESDADPRLVLLSRVNAARFLCDAGEPEQAGEILAQTKTMAEGLGDPIHAVRRSWIQAKIFSAQRDLDSAERTLVAVRDALAEKGLRYDKALASLDLARLYAEEGRSQDSAELLELATPVFQELAVATKVREAQALQERVSRT